MRRRGQTVMRQRKRAWEELVDLCDSGTGMSEDLRAYLLLKNMGLSRDYRRQILLASSS